jgi:hypothetical protein
VAESRKNWWERPNRVLLVNLREGDEPKIDARELVREVKSFGATAFCINGGGIVAFYQTRVPGHRLSSGLNGRDLLGEVIPVAHQEGLRVLARIDPSCAPKALAAQHPEWFTRDRDGRLCEVSGHYVTCPSAGYYYERMAEIVTEILERYDADGIWNNQGKFAAWDTDVCYCDTCRRRFREETGHDIPLEEDWASTAWREYNEWRYRQIARWIAHMHGTIHRAKSDAVFIAAVQLIESLETIRPGGWDIDYWIPHQDVLTFECQRRNTAPWWPGIQAKYLSGLDACKPCWMTVSYFYPWWRLYAAPEAENRPWIAQQFANGVSSWLHINGGYSDLFDRRGLAPMREVFQRLARWESYFDGARSDARVALVYSRHTQDNYGGGKPHARYLDFVRGAYCALQEAHIPFDVISDKFLTRERIRDYRVLVLPNLACVADDTATMLDDFVRSGGSVVASFETGFFDLSGQPRMQPAFAGLFGGAYGRRREELKSSYAQIRDHADPLLAGIGDTDLVPNDGALIEFLPNAGCAVPLTLIPPVVAHSGATISIPEYSAIGATTEIPVAVRKTHGAGRVVYFANQMECLFYRYGFRDLGVIFANAVKCCLAEDAHLEVDAPDFVDIALRSQPGRKLLHLINMPVGKPVNSGWRYPGRNLVPLSNLGVGLKLDRGQRMREVCLASNGQPLDFVCADGWVRTNVPRLDNHEIVVFQFD